MATSADSVPLSSIAGMRRVLVEGRVLEVTTAPERELRGLVVVVLSQWKGWQVSRLGHPRSGWIEAPTSKRVIFEPDGSATLLDEAGRRRWVIRATVRLTA